MKKVFAGLCILAALVGVSIAAEDKTPDVSEIMKKVNGKAGIQKKVGDGLKAPTPDWDELAKQTKEYKKFADAMGKNTAPKGDQKAWEKASKKWAEDVKKLDDACGKKDATEAKKIHGELQKACGACHKAHKP